jgi:hypothetical protein
MSQNVRLTANRGDSDEPWRLVRVAKALGIIEYLTPGKPIVLLGLHDHKGGLAVNWADYSDYRRGHDAVAKAWELLDHCSGLIDHFVAGKWVDGDRFFGNDYPAADNEANSSTSEKAA